MQLSKTQITALLTEVASQEDGFNEVIRMSFEALMKAKRQEYLLQTAEDKGNGFRQVRAYAFDNTQTVAGNCCAATPCDFKLPRIFSLVKKIFAKKLRNQIVAHIFATDWLRKQKFKQLKRDVLPVIAEWLNQFRKIWETRFDQLDKVLSTIKKQKK